ncbi:MAG TPA: hypothetical protein DCL80_06355 [Balneola sp.]|nr:hypothetical protein [Balneola sp.]
MKDKSKDNYFKGNLEDTRSFIKTNFSYLNSQVENASSNARKRLIESTNITGINDGNFDLAWESFMGNVKPKDIYTNLKNDPNHEGLNPSQLVSKHLLALWKRSTGKMERRALLSPIRWMPGESLHISDLKF